MQRIFLIVSLICISFVTAQDATNNDLSLDRIYGSQEFRAERFGPARWLADGSGYTTLEPSEKFEKRKDIVFYSPKNNKRKVLVSAGKLMPANADSALNVYDYHWSPDKRYLLIFTNTRKVWRLHTRGDYWVIDQKSGKLRQLGGDADEARMMFATFSPDSRKIAYVIHHNIYVEDLANGKITQITKDGSKTTINGTFDWVYEEEFGLRNGFRWSPDSKWIAYWQLDASGIGEFYMINNTDSIYSKIIPLQYPKAGTINSACKTGVVSADGGETLWFKTPGDPRNTYIAYLDWAANSDEVMIQHLNRLQNTNRVMIGDRKTGAVKTIFTDKDDAWVEVVDDILWLNNDREFTWVSERDGWRRVYRIARDGSSVEAITKEDFDALSVVHIDVKSGWVYYMASPDNPTQRYLYRSRIDGKSKAERVTPAANAGMNRYQMSPDSRWAFHTHSSFTSPPVISLVTLPKHKAVRTMEANEKLRTAVDALDLGKSEFFRVDIGDGVELDAWRILPPHFDPDKKYPLFFFVYGEPAGQTVMDRWSGSRYLWHQMLAQQGYVVMSVDNRGTPAPRGRAWRKSIYGQIGILASQDQAAAAQKILATHPYIDSERIGIWGWSGGGSMTLNMMFRYPEIYHTGIAIAFVANQRYYDTIYQERYMGLPSENVDGFRDGSPINFAQQLEGNLLIIHGTGDDNVHYQSFEALTNELIRHHKHFTMMAYPNRAHGIREGENTTRHLFTLMTRYLNENLPAGAKAEVVN